MRVCGHSGFRPSRRRVPLGVQTLQYCRCAAITAPRIRECRIDTEKTPCALTQLSVPYTPTCNSVFKVPESVVYPLQKIALIRTTKRINDFSLSLSLSPNSIVVYHTNYCGTTWLPRVRVAVGYDNSFSSLPFSSRLTANPANTRTPPPSSVTLTLSVVPVRTRPTRDRSASTTAYPERCARVWYVIRLKGLTGRRRPKQDRVPCGGGWDVCFASGNNALPATGHPLAGSFSPRFAVFLSTSIAHVTHTAPDFVVVKSGASAERKRRRINNTFLWPSSPALLWPAGKSESLDINVTFLAVSAPGWPSWAHALSRNRNHIAERVFAAKRNESTRVDSHHRCSSAGNRRRVWECTSQNYVSIGF